MVSDHTRRANFEFLAHVAGLLLFGFLFGAVCVEVEGRLPRPIYFDPSFTFSLVRQVTAALALAAFSLVLVVWLFLPSGRDRFRWEQVDSVGGFRWPIFVAALALTWNYAGYPYNYFFDQSHVWDRWLLVLLTIGMLRSPILIPIFVLEIVVSRLQFGHPMNSMTPIADDLPIKVLGIVFGCALWNGLTDLLKAGRSGSRFGFLEGWPLAGRIGTHSLVYSVLCMIAFYYVVAGMGKMLLGESPLDWMRFSHMENLYVASYLNGWLNHVPVERVLEIAEYVRALSLTIAIATLAIELGMFFILLRQRGTLLLLAAVSSMHLGIVVMSGIIFWKWMALDLSLLAWLWFRRHDPGIGRMYSTTKGVASLLIIAAIVAGFHGNKFSWWNTKWIMLYEIEVLDEAGNIYRLDHADLSPPYNVFDLYKPPGRRLNTYTYATANDQWLMQMFEDGGLMNLQRYRAQGEKREGGSLNELKEGAFRGFMATYFHNRNKAPGRSVPPFLLPSPSLHNRRLSGPNLYRDQAPVVEARLRFIEIYYTGSELRRMRDEVVYSVPIPP